MSDTDMLAHYSRALDEIWRLRLALAVEARTAEGILEYSTLPVRARKTLQTQIERMRQAGRGEAGEAYSTVSSASRQWVMEHTGIPARLTRGQWEADHA